MSEQPITREMLNVGTKCLFYLGLGEYKEGTIKSFMGEDDRLSCVYINTEEDNTLPINCVVKILSD